MTGREYWHLAGWEKTGRARVKHFFRSGEDASVCRNRARDLFRQLFVEGPKCKRCCAMVSSEEEMWARRAREIELKQKQRGGHG